MTIRKFWLLLLGTVLMAGCGKDKTSDGGEPAPEPPAPEEVAVNPFSWTSVDGLGRTIEPGVNVPKPRPGKTVGIFYFIWLGAHGYDTHADHNDVQRPSAGDRKSPYDIQKLLDRNSLNPEYGPVGAFHHWGEPYLGYYVSNDEWVIRKHAQMLSDAGVDVIILDMTNANIYLPIVKRIGDVYTKIRSEGGRTPQFACIINSEARQTMADLYSAVYAKGLYKDLWFQWKGKPLVLCPPEGVTDRIASFFTVRHSWFSTQPGENAWFGDGRDKWPWGDKYPQTAGWHEAGKPECVAVMPATHPTSNIGRSFDTEKNYQPPTHRSGEGAYFQSQFRQAIQIDPEFLFFTGWNEWVAMRFVSEGGGQPMLGRPLPAGGSFFVDQYNHEFSRDLEPLRGDFGDNYYYQLCQFVRRFKGSDPAPVYKSVEKVSVDGDFSDWKDVQAVYADDQGDTKHRDHFGWGNVGQLVNATGRNDIVRTKVANDGANLYFYVRTAADITPRTDKNWMRLLIDVTDSQEPAWEGFRFMVNRSVSDAQRTSLDACRGGWSWEKKEDISYRVEGSEMELAIPLASLGIRDAGRFTIDFKWVDNALSSGDIQQCLSDGDSAPNGRFRYRYRFRK